MCVFACVRACVRAQVCRLLNFDNLEILEVEAFLAVVRFHPTQSIIYVHFLARFQEIILTFVQYKHKKSCAEDQMLKDLILRTSVCGTGFIIQRGESFISAWPKWSE